MTPPLTNSAYFDFTYESKTINGEKVFLKNGYQVTLDGKTFISQRWPDLLYKANIVYFKQPLLQ